MSLQFVAIGLDEVYPLRSVLSSVARGGRIELSLQTRLIRGHDRGHDRGRGRGRGDDRQERPWRG